MIYLVLALATLAGFAFGVIFMDKRWRRGSWNTGFTARLDGIVCTVDHDRGTGPEATVTMTFTAASMEAPGMLMANSPIGRRVWIRLDKGLTRDAR